MRPTEYDDEVLRLANEYIDDFDSLDGDELVPSIVGLCRHIGRARSTVYKWASEEGKEAFSDIVNRVEEIQHLKLVNGGLGGKYHPMIAKLMLSKHGYSEKQEIDHQSSDGSMKPNCIQLVAPSEDE